MKLCKICKVEKPLDEFHIMPNGKDGRRAICKSCFNETMRHKQKKAHPTDPIETTVSRLKPFDLVVGDKVKGFDFALLKNRKGVVESISNDIFTVACTHYKNSYSKIDYRMGKVVRCD